MRHRQTTPPPASSPTADEPAHSAERLERVHRRGRLGRFGVWVALACGPLALFASCAASRAQPVRMHRAQPPVHASQGAQDPAGYAQLIVGLWLRAAGTDSASAQVHALHALAPALTPPTGQTPVRVDQVAVVRSVAVGAGAWSVTVAAALAPPAGPATSDPSGAGTVPVRYFQLPVQLTGSGPASSGTLTVTGAPAEVGAPTVTAPASSPYTAGVVPGSPLAQTVSAFAQAFLASNGDLTPLLSPGAHVDPVTAPPYAQVQVVQVAADRPGLDGQVPADGTTAHVLAQLTATDHTGTAWPYTYALTLRTRAGRWEVAAVDPAPQQAAAPPTSTGSAAATPTASGS